MRILSFLVAAVVLMSCMVPAFASSFDVGSADRVWYQVLDFTNGDDPLKNPDQEQENAFQVYSSDKATSWIRFELPGSIPCYEVDLLVKVTNAADHITSVKIRNHQNQEASLTVDHLGNGVYRIYGSTSPITSGPYFDLKFFLDDYGTFVTVSSFRVFRSNSVGYLLPNNKFWYSWYNNWFSVQNQDGNFSGIQPFDFSDVPNMIVIQHELTLALNPWKDYDYIGVRMALEGNINSISVFANSIPLPFEVSIVGSSFDSDFSYSGLYEEFSGLGAGSIEVLPELDNGGGRTQSMITILVDLRSLSKLSKNNPTIVINGSFYGGSAYSITSDIYGKSTPVQITGYVEYTNNNPINYWLKTIGLRITNGFALLAEKLDVLIANTSKADDFQDVIESQGKDLEDLAGDLDSVEKPDVEDIEVDLDGLVPLEDVNRSTAVLSSIMTNEIFMPMIMISLTLAFCAYALYGKR